MEEKIEILEVSSMDTKDYKKVDISRLDEEVELTLGKFGRNHAMIYRLYLDLLKSKKGEGRINTPPAKAGGFNLPKDGQ